MNTDSLAFLNERLVLALSLYPLIVGLYAAGFFWEIPFDAIGAFELTDFLFKASIAYAFAAAVVIIPLLILATVIAPISAEMRAGESAKEVDHERWRTMSLQRKIIFVLAALSLIALFGYFFAKDPFSIEFTPVGFFLVLGSIYLFSNVARPFLSEANFRAGKTLLILTALLIAPILAGYSDALPTDGGPSLEVKDESCPVIFVGSETILVRCANTVAVVPSSEANQLIWKIRMID